MSNSNYEPMVCAYVLLLMAIYWITAALPLPVTSLIPLIAFPLFGVLSTVLQHMPFMFLKSLVIGSLSDLIIVFKKKFFYSICVFSNS